MGRKKKLINNSNIPQYAIETVARCLLPDIIAYYESKEGQREFAEWKQQEDNKDVSGDKIARYIQAVHVKFNLPAQT